MTDQMTDGTSDQSILGIRRSSTCRAAGWPAVVVLLLGVSTACGGDPPGTITPPEPLYQKLDVVYPITLWDREVEGRTILRVRIDEDGTVGEVRVTVPSGEAAFDTAAVRGLRAARFSPALRDGEEISIWATLPVVFSKKPG